MLGESDMWGLATLKHIYNTHTHTYIHVPPVPYFSITIFGTAYASGTAVQGDELQTITCWECWGSSLAGGMWIASFECCVLSEFSATGRSLVLGSPTDCGESKWMCLGKPHLENAQARGSCSAVRKKVLGTTDKEKYWTITITYLWFRASVAVKMRSPLFRDVTERRLVVCYRRFSVSFVSRSKFQHIKQRHGRFLQQCFQIVILYLSYLLTLCTMLLQLALSSNISIKCTCPTFIVVQNNSFFMTRLFTPPPHPPLFNHKLSASQSWFSATILRLWRNTWNRFTNIVKYHKQIFKSASKHHGSFRPSVGNTGVSFVRQKQTFFFWHVNFFIRRIWLG